MSSTVYVMEAANIFAGDIDPDLSNHLTVSELKLPTLEEATVDHMPGGAAVAVEFDVHMNKLESTFNLMGWQPKTMGLIGRWVSAGQRFTIYGAIRDRQTGKAVRATAIIWGRLGRVNPTNYRRGDLMQHEYSIKSIMHYQLLMAGQGEIFYFDFFENARRSGGVDINSDINTILGIPSSPSSAAETSTANGVQNNAPGAINA